jgi:hypothetical protein
MEVLCKLHLEFCLNTGERLWCWSRRIGLSATREYRDALETGLISSILISFFGERGQRIDLEHLDSLDLACPAMVLCKKLRHADTDCTQRVITIALLCDF